MKDLEQVMKEIKKGKSRDPEGICREIFQPSVIGNNLKLSLLIMFNQLKNLRKSSFIHQKSHNITHTQNMK